MTEKIMQDTLAWVENIAKARGRNVDWAKRAVEESESVTEEKALKLGVIDLIAESEKELLEKIDGKTITLNNDKQVTLATKGAVVQTIELNWRQSLLNVLNNPSIAYILLTLGFYGLIFVITHPGSWAPGVAGLICLLLAFYSFHIIPTDYAGIILTVVGLALLGAELFVTSAGLLAIGGFVCLFFGAVFLVDQPAEFLELSLHVVIPTLAASAAIFGLLFTLVLKSRRQKVTTGEEAFAGAIGLADSDISPSGGKVFVQGELWNALAEEPIAKGEKVEILKLENFKLYVRRRSP
ncbi:MAG: nodulation protein NfeD [Deltaproteobacteria bacterium]|nr:nodulation protein NfeD [Deltaproteobacteria bacterium]